MYKNIFDTHSHYDDEQFNDDRSELIKNVFDSGVVGIVSCGCDIETTRQNQILSHEYENYYFAAGFHPECLEGHDISELNIIREIATSDEKCVAIGEIGLDYHWMSSTKEKQRDFLIKQIEMAKEIKRPVIIHDREAHGDTMDILRDTKPAGVVHCFSGSKEMAREIVKLGMYIGMNGVVTFKNARKSLEVIHEIPLEMLVLETDCPYLAPVPHRGKRNDSTFIPFIAQRIGDELNMDAQEILDITHKNAMRLYNL